MRLQLISDLHLETEPFEPVPAPGADLLVLAGDIDSSWDGLARFRGDSLKGYLQRSVAGERSQVLRSS